MEYHYEVLNEKSKLKLTELKDVLKFLLQKKKISLNYSDKRKILEYHEHKLSNLYPI